MDYARNPSPIRAPISSRLTPSSQPLKSYNRSHMQPALRSPIPDATLAVFPVNGENSHQGLADRNPAPNQVREVCNFTVLLGLQSTAVLNRVGPRSTGKERDTESGNDYFEARYYSSAMGRFMSPDPSGGHTEDPQTLNKYSYVANNPLIRTDPTGLDFNLQCSGGNTATCRDGTQGTTTTGANGKSTFTATVISNGKDGGLVDQNGNKYNATVSGAGVSFSQDGSKQSSIGTFINGTNATTIQGSGALSGFTFNFTGSKMGSNVNAFGTFTYNGNANQAVAALQQAGFQHYTQDEYLDPFHLSTNTYNAYDLRAPGGQGGAGAGHVMVEFPVVSTYGEGAQRIPITTVPTSGTLDLGDHNPWNGGFGAHFGEAWKGLKQ
jgi:RHS repeat-associated protein